MLLALRYGARCPALVPARHLALCQNYRRARTDTYVEMKSIEERNALLSRKSLSVRKRWGHGGKGWARRWNKWLHHFAWMHLATWMIRKNGNGFSCIPIDLQE